MISERKSADAILILHSNGSEHCAPGSTDLFAVALDAEGILCDGHFYEAVYRSDLFYTDSKISPQLRLDREEPVDYAKTYCPVSELAAYEEAIWFPQFLHIGDTGDVEDIARAETLFQHS